MTVKVQEQVEILEVDENGKDVEVETEGIHEDVIDMEEVSPNMMIRRLILQMKKYKIIFYPQRAMIHFLMKYFYFNLLQQEEMNKVWRLVLLIMQ